MCAGGALGPRPGAGGGLRAGRFRVGSPAPPLRSPFCGPCGDRPSGGPPREARGGLTALAPRSRPGPGTLLSRPLEAPGEASRVGAAGWSARTPPLGESWRRRCCARGWLGPCFPSPSLSPPPSGFRGLRTEGREPGTRAPYSPGLALGLKPGGLVTGRGNFPKPEPEPEPEHPPPPPRPLIPLPLHLLRLLPLPPTRILLCLTDGAVSQWKAGTDLTGVGKPMVEARGRKGVGFLSTS